MTHKEIVMKLIGPISPVGCSSRDPQRFKNLEALCELTYALLEEIDSISINKHSYEHSVKKAGEYSEKYIKEVKRGLKQKH